MALFEDIWRKGLNARSMPVRALRFGFGKAIRPLTKKVLSYDDDFTPQSYTYITADGRFCRAVRAARNHYPVKGPRL